MVPTFEPAILWCLASAAVFFFNEKSLLWYQLCLIQHYWNQPGRTPTLYWPQNLQFTVWTLHKMTQQLHSWILQLVSAQIQLSQVGGVDLQSWGQRSTADLWQTAVTQPENRINVTLEDNVSVWNHSMFNLFRAEKGLNVEELQTPEPNRLTLKKHSH